MDMEIALAALVAATITGVVLVVAVNLVRPSRRLDARFARTPAADDPRLAESLVRLLGAPIREGTRLATLHNGVEIFPAMLEAVRSARRSITFEQCIYWAGDVAAAFADALSERAAAGVKVHVLLDGIGCHWIDRQHVRRMAAAGVQVRKHNPVRLSTLLRVNERTHRKLLVVDGRVGFTGGVGIADRWKGNADSPGLWRESHYRVEGPAVADLQQAFLDNWMQVSPDVLCDDGYFPPLETAGDARVQVYSTSPRRRRHDLRLMFLMLLAAARHDIRLATTYFVPDDRSIATLAAAARRGVRVQVVMPGRNIDVQFSRFASRRRWGELLLAGCELYEYERAMYHRKSLVIDEGVVSVGSANFNSRSFWRDDEAGLNVFDAGFARQQIADFEADKAESRRLTLDGWRQRGWQDRFVESAAYLFRAHL
jgi:cardiolipin synthase A/B